MRRAWSRVASWAALLLCGGGAACAESVPDARDETNAVVAVAEDTGASGPGKVYVDENRCPFECCTYREWGARKPLIAYAAERDTSNVAFTLAAGERFTAVTGNVHVDPVGVAVVRQPVSWFAEGGGSGNFAPGDTLYILGYVGEGSFRVWHRGRIGEVSAFWLAQPDLNSAEAAAEGVLIREPGSDWWVRIRNSAGRTGWLRMADAEVNNADACGL